MKLPITWSLSVLLLLSVAVSAQESHGDGATAGSADEGRAMIREARLEIVRSEFTLTADQSAEFWPLYLTYRGKMDAIQDRYGDMVADYLRRYNEANLTDEYADEMMSDYFDIQGELLATQEKYLPKFRSILPGLKVAKLYQLENKINADIDAQLANAIPLIESN